MKAKSMKLRTLITLFALFKYSDSNHRLNTVKLNEYLRPYGLDCTSRVLNDTVRVLQDFGVDVRNKGVWDNQGIWLEDRPMSNKDLHRLIYAITTNPHLTTSQVNDVLESLKPLVTVYQEEQLCSVVETSPAIRSNKHLYEVYSVICEAIRKKVRVLYTVEYVKYHKETQSLSVNQEWGTLFAPKSIYQTNNALYMLGYNSTDRKVAAVDLKEITSIKLAFKRDEANYTRVEAKLNEIQPKELVPGENREVIYKGPVTFFCRGQYAGDLHQKFGPPEGPVLKDVRGRTTYVVAEAEITAETLFWLSQVKDYGIHIKAPVELTKAIKTYYDRVGKALTNPKIPYNKKKQAFD